MNKRIGNRNKRRVNEVKNDLTKFFKLNDSEGFKNSNGEKVTFKFNFSTFETNDTSGKSELNGLSAHQFAQTMGLESTETTSDGKPINSPASVFTTERSRGSHGSTVGSIVQSFYPENGGEASHEQAHTLGLKDNGYNQGGILNFPPQLPIKNEIDIIINKSVEGNQN